MRAPNTFPPLSPVSLLYTASSPCRRYIYELRLSLPLAFALSLSLSFSLSVSLSVSDLQREDDIRICLRAHINTNTAQYTWNLGRFV